jgi:hypothetical protein
MNGTELFGDSSIATPQAATHTEIRFVASFINPRRLSSASRRHKCYNKGRQRNIGIGRSTRNQI